MYAVAHLHINSLRDKFKNLVDKITGNDEILLVSETKLGNSFTAGQFLIKGHSPPFRWDRDSQGGGILLFVREDIPSRLVTIEPYPAESFFVEINLKKVVMLLI